MRDDRDAGAAEAAGSSITGVVQQVIARSAGRGRQIVDVRHTTTVFDGTRTRSRTTRTRHDTDQEGTHMNPETHATDEASTPRPAGLSEQELAAEGAEQLPDREAMSLINANLAAPVNVAAALNVLSDDSVAVANAEQTADITQSN
jgi:hypothetical protein